MAFLLLPAEDRNDSPNICMQRPLFACQLVCVLISTKIMQHIRLSVRLDCTILEFEDYERIYLGGIQVANLLSLKSNLSLYFLWIFLYIINHDVNAN